VTRFTGLTLISIGLYSLFNTASSFADVSIDDKQHCLLQQLQLAQGPETVAELRNYCKQQAAQNRAKELVDTEVPEENSAEQALSDRIATESLAEHNPFTISSYRPNYLLYASYNSNPNKESFKATFPDGDVDRVEAKLQISFKARVAKGVLGGDLWAAYSQQSWWQVYNNEESAPFRETNYEPELFLSWNTKFEVLGFTNRILTLGFNHESNGRDDPLSRSWNRIVGGGTLEQGNLVLAGRAWYRLPEDDDDDDNPDILKYTGYGDISVFYKYKKQLLGITLTNNLRSDNKGAIQLDWTFPMGDRFKGYLQYYNGYGESLIDYDHSINRIGIGILLNDWL